MITLSIITICFIVLLSVCISKWILVVFNLFLVIFGLIGVVVHLIDVIEDYLEGMKK